MDALFPQSTQAETHLPDYDAPTEWVTKLKSYRHSAPTYLVPSTIHHRLLPHLDCAPKLRLTDLPLMDEVESKPLK
jgi:hypothetical protein